MEGVVACPVCGGRLLSADLLPTHVDFCLARLEREEEEKKPPQQQAARCTVPTSPRRDTGGGTTNSSTSTSSGGNGRDGGGGTPRTSTSSSAATTPGGNSDTSASKESSAAAPPGGSGGGLRGVLNLFGRGRRTNTQQINVKREYKRLRKDIVESPLCYCTKREAVQLAAIALRLDIAREERRSKKPKKELDFFKKEIQKPNLSQYYPAHWRSKTEAAELSAELLEEFERIDESADTMEPSAIEEQLRKQYVDICQGLPFYGMTVYSVLEWRVKSDDSAKLTIPDRDDDDQFQEEEKKSYGSTKEEQKAMKKEQKKREKLEKERIKELEKQEKAKNKKAKKVKYEKVPVSFGITSNCSLVKITDRTGEIETAMRITQLKSYSLMVREGRQSQRRPVPQNLTTDDFIITLDFGEFFPHYLQLINRRSNGLLGPRGQKLRDGAMLRLVGEDEDSIRMIYAQIHSYIQEATGRAREDRRRMEERLKLYGLRERDVVGDGNCQMRAISYQLFNTEDRHNEIRRSVVRWLRTNSNYPVRETSSGRIISRLIDFLETDYHRSWSDYCSYMSKDQSWGYVNMLYRGFTSVQLLTLELPLNSDHITLLAAAEVYSINIWILSSVDVSNEHGEPSPEGVAYEMGSVLKFSSASDVISLTSNKTREACRNQIKKH